MRWHYVKYVLAFFRGYRVLVKSRPWSLSTCWKKKRFYSGRKYALQTSHLVCHFSQSFFTPFSIFLIVKRLCVLLTISICLRLSQWQEQNAGTSETALKKVAHCPVCHHPGEWSKIFIHKITSDSALYLCDTSFWTMIYKCYKIWILWVVFFFFFIFYVLCKPPRFCKGTWTKRLFALQKQSFLSSSRLWLPVSLWLAPLRKDPPSPVLWDKYKEVRTKSHLVPLI